MRKEGFTLAEVLVTLSILGVVAAITIPNIIQNYKEKATVVKLKKVYAQLQQAFDIEEAINGPIETWGNENGGNVICSTSEANKKGCIATHGNDRHYVNGYVSLIMRNIAQAKTCSTDLNHPNGANDGCYFKSNEGTIYKLMGSAYNLFTQPILYSDYNNRYLTKDGTFIYVSIYYPPQPFTYENLETKYYAIFIVDLNGKKAPNTYGRDIFQFFLTPQGIIPNGGSSGHNQYCNSKNNPNAIGQSCARWVIERGNMDYLRKTTTW